jgi:methylglutaconyl-CoA hydratase
MIVDEKDVRSGYVKSETHEHITSIEFFHPQSNSLPHSILERLAQEIHYYSHDAGTRVIILKSAGEKAFCAGASFEELSSIKTEEEGITFFSGFANVINAMRKCPKIIIGRIHGKCVGGGVGLASAVDYAIAIEGAEIKLSELAIGIGPFVVGPAVERKLGKSSFSQLAIDAGSWRNGDWARRKGLYAELHPNIESMEESISRLSRTLSQYSAEAMAELKKVLWDGTEHWDHLLPERAALSGKLILGEFSQNFIRSFREKRQKT